MKQQPSHHSQQLPQQRLLSHTMVLVLILAVLLPLSHGSIHEIINNNDASSITSRISNTSNSIACLMEQVETHFPDQTVQKELYCIPVNHHSDKNDQHHDDTALFIENFPSEILLKHASALQQGRLVCQIDHYEEYKNKTKYTNSLQILLTHQSTVQVLPPRMNENDSHQHHAHRRAVDFSYSTGQHSVAIIYVSTPDAKVEYSIAQVRQHVFDNPTGSLQSQLAQCSHGKMTITNAGIHAVRLDDPIATFTNEPQMRHATYDKMKQMGLITSKAQELADHVIFMFPKFVKLEDCFVHKSSTVNKWFAAVQNEWALDLMTLMHVLGHNMGLENAGRAENNNSQGDWTSNMGSANTFPQLSQPLKCFNAYEHHQLKWYDNNDNRKVRYITAPETLPAVSLAPFTHYSQLGPQDDHSIVLLVIENFALQYNKADSFNAGTELYKDMITISEYRDGQTWLVTGLAPSESYQLILKDDTNRRGRHLQDSETVRALTVQAGQLQVDASGNEFIGVSAEVETVVIGPTQSPSTSPTQPPVTSVPSTNPSDASPAYFASPIAPSAFTPTAPIFFEPIEPSVAPLAPSSLPSEHPTITMSPSLSPSQTPTETVSGVPSLSPSNGPSAQASNVPSGTPSIGPSAQPVTNLPSANPSSMVSQAPSVSTSTSPSSSPVDTSTVATMTTSVATKAVTSTTVAATSTTTVEEASTTLITSEVTTSSTESLSTTAAEATTAHASSTEQTTSSSAALESTTTITTSTLPSSPANGDNEDTTSESDTLLAEPIVMIIDNTTNAWDSPVVIALLSIIAVLALVVCTILSCLYCRIQKLEGASPHVKPKDADEDTADDEMSHGSHGFLDDTHLQPNDIETGVGAAALLDDSNSSKEDKKRQKFEKDASPKPRKDAKHKKKSKKKHKHSSSEQDITQTSTSSSIDGDGIDLSLNAGTVGSAASEEMSWKRVPPSHTPGQQATMDGQLGTSPSPTRIPAKTSAFDRSEMMEKTSSDRSLGLPPPRHVSNEELPRVAVDMGFMKREVVELADSDEDEAGGNALPGVSNSSTCSSIFSVESFPSDDDDSNDESEKLNEEARRETPTLRVLGEGLAILTSSALSRSSSCSSGMYSANDIFPIESDDEQENPIPKPGDAPEPRLHSTKWSSPSESAQRASTEHHLVPDDYLDDGDFDEEEPAEDFLLPWKGVDKSIARR